VKSLQDGSKAVGLFYPADEFNEPADYFNWDGREEAEVMFTGEELGIVGEYSVRDLWRQEDLGTHSGPFSRAVPYHGVVLLRVKEVAE